MKFDSKSVFFAAALGAGAFGLTSLSTSSASAAASCAGAGYLCFYDSQTSQYGSFAGDNNWWGTYGWNDRADWFKNDGRQMHVCVYADINRGGAAWFIPRNAQWYSGPSNAVSSNAWTSAGNVGGCPR